eukprot:11617640-Alexandrium_andersonii.AAC.1
MGLARNSQNYELTVLRNSLQCARDHSEAGTRRLAASEGRVLDSGISNVASGTPILESCARG